MHECARNHVSSQWHKESSVMAANFKSVKYGTQMDIVQQIDSSMAKQVKDNREKLLPIISTIVFCGTHDLALRGKESSSGNFVDLLKFRIHAGDRVLQQHLEYCPGNAKYTSVQVQNELIGICGQVLRKQMVDEVNKGYGFSILADETADISGKEQLSIGIRYVDSNYNIKEEFLGFQQLEKLDADAISHAILKVLADCGLDMDKLVGLGFDGCATMAGKETGVQQRIKMKHPKANFFHCASHRLNLVINDLCAVREIQNCCSSIKEIVKFFRESVLRRRLVANLPLLCETRWSAKYKSIRIFYENFINIIHALEDLATNAEYNAATRSKAHQLYLAACQSNFIVAMVIIAKYSSKLEPVVNTLQGININLLDVKNHIGIIEETLKKHRSDHETYFANIYQEATEIGNKIGKQMEMPRIVQRQKHRSNPALGTNAPEEYFRKILYVPYLDSIISSITSLFEETNTPAFALSLLHPKFVTSTEQSHLMAQLKSAEQFYGIENHCEETDTWLHYWKSKTIPADMTLHDALAETEFFPAVAKGIIIFMTLPPTTCTVERSFSTLRRVKTWLRSTMTTQRLDGLCMLSVHREKVKVDIDQFCQSVLDIFAQTPRNLMFAFSDKYA
ncbi:52 kDa repressor of the inhibitor of the protein kinase-like [Photinus pyralis]|uniref:52 kDa repressor of the inhibitor of the protein kinase-like n=1 Tax=Photinus pyralis TaxID=7054 RepID=UPI0012670FE7|nr:52 kDa repressor of the inhibitor of the protein kinase-like [Photinus pyralis]